MGLDQYLYLRIPDAVDAEFVGTAVARDGYWGKVGNTDRFFNPQTEDDRIDAASGLYIGGWPHMRESESGAWVAEIATYDEMVDLLGVTPASDSPSFHLYADGTVDVTIAYWRKANAIHRWFVDNCQNGVDECQLSDPISPEQLAHLCRICADVLADPAAKAMDLLPPQQGFFFGGYDIDEWYLHGLKSTIEQVEAAVQVALGRALLSPGQTFHYRSSW